MTNNRNYYTSSNYANTIPTRDEFHRYTSNLLTNGDFCTDYSSGYQIDRVAQSIDWTRKKTKPKTNINKKGNK